MSLLKSLGIDRLSAAERMQLLEEIWDNLAEDPDQIPLTDAQRHELDRRLAAHRANPAGVIPWETIEADARARFRQ